MITEAQLEQAVQAARSAEGFIGNFISEDQQRSMVAGIIRAADASSNQTPHGRFNAAKNMFEDQMAKSGHAGALGDDMVTNIVNAVLATRT